MHAVQHHLRHYPFVLLFIALVGYILVQPIFLNAGRSGVLAVSTTVVLVAAMFAVSGSTTSFVVGIVAGLPLLLLMWAAAIGAIDFAMPERTFEPKVYGVALVSGVVFHGYIAVLMLRHVYRSVHVNLNMLSGAACVYLLAGVTWGFAYELTESVNPDAFAIAPGLLLEGEATLELFMYFSFTTLTTLGYGDMSPLGPIARALTSLEAIFGVLYTTIVIARFVGLFLTAARFERRHHAQDQPVPRAPADERGHAGDRAAQ